MATIKLGTTGSTNRLISYAEKKAVEREGVDCNPEYAKSQFATTRELYGKTDGIQAHHVIQSFKPGEITPDQANKVGLDLARKLGKGHECVVYTHADKDHIHNHIVINSVNHENGKKLHLHGQQAIDKVRGLSDELCKDRGLSVVKEPTAKVRYTMAEKSVIEKGGVSWKDELRQAIDFEKAHSTSYKDFKQNLTEKYGIEVNDKGKHITYKHPDHEKVVRGNKLGLDYERGTIEHGFSRQIERADGERERSSDQAREQSRTQSTDGANNRVEQAHAELHKGSSERGHHEKADGGKRTGEREKDQSRGSGEHDFDFEKARKHAEELRRNSTKSIEQWRENHERDKSISTSENVPSRNITSKRSKDYGRERGKNDCEIDR